MVYVKIIYIEENAVFAAACDCGTPQTFLLTFLTI